MVLRVPNPPLSDGVVTLRPPAERDLTAIDLGLHDSDVVRWFGRPGASASDVLELNRRRWAEGSPTFAICEMDLRCVGHVWMNLAAEDSTIGFIGYWLLPVARGRGLATRAVRLISDWAVHDIGMSRLRLVTEPDNQRSRRVAERSGYQLIAILAGHGEVDGRSVDHALYELDGRGFASGDQPPGA